MFRLRKSALEGLTHVHQVFVTASLRTAEVSGSFDGLGFFQDVSMRLWLPCAIGFTAMLALAACHQEGPAERAGKSLDNAGQSVSDTLNPPQGPAQSAGRKVDRALGN
jgi:hypothetical protein